MLNKTVRIIFTACFYQNLAERQVGTISTISDFVVNLEGVAKDKLKNNSLGRRLQEVIANPR